MHCIYYRITVADYGTTHAVRPNRGFPSRRPVSAGPFGCGQIRSSNNNNNNNNKTNNNNNNDHNNDSDNDTNTNSNNHNNISI